jgi:hypothetical protein
MLTAQPRIVAVMNTPHEPVSRFGGPVVVAPSNLDFFDALGCIAVAIDPGPSFRRSRVVMQPGLEVPHQV